MTLADLIRKYLEERRKTCEQKARYLGWSKNFQHCTDHDENENTLNISNVQFFSNNLDPKPTDQSRVGGSPNRKTYTQSVGVSKSSRVVTLPDGTVQTETIIRDSNGNEEKHISHQKDGKKYTTITRRDASGHEKIEQKVTEANDPIPFNNFPSVPYPAPRIQNSDDDYNYWFNKFFKPQIDEPRSDMQNDVSSLNPDLNVDEHIEKIIKGFSNADFFSPPETFRRDEPRDQAGVSPDDFSSNLPESFFNDETRRILESFGATELSENNSKINNGIDTGKMQKQMKKMLKGLTPPKPPSMFEQFSEEALTELPNETPFDKYADVDEDRINKSNTLSQKNRGIVDKLDQIFSNGLTDNNVNTDVYSDIEDPKDISLFPMMPESQPQFPSDFNNFGNLIKKALDPRNFAGGGNMQTQMYIENGKRRIESISKDDKGNTKKKITYEVGLKSYSVDVMTDRSGRLIKREKSLNFPENELPEFKKLWSKRFHADFFDE